jgi:hypothetical protein
MPSDETDDLAAYIPTFVVKRELPLQMSRQYVPINKPHALTKWLQSKDAPKEDIIALVDPDCFFVKDLGPWTDKVAEGHAIGQAAYYEWDTTNLQKVFDAYCKKNCKVGTQSHHSIYCSLPHSLHYSSSLPASSSSSPSSSSSSSPVPHQAHRSAISST